MAKQSRSKKGSRKTRVAKASPSKTTRKAAKTPRKVKGASSPSEPRKAARARKPRPPKPAEVYGHDAPYNCDDPFMKEPVRLRVCRPDPKKPGRRKCDQRAFVVEGCATPGPGRRAKQMFVVPHTHQYLAPRREVARAKEMPLLDNGDCADARFAHSRGQQIPKSAYDQCRISVDSSTVSLPNGYGRARGMAARGSRHNPPLLVPGRDYRWHSGHGGSGIVTYLGGDGRVARVSMNGSVFGVPTRELLPMGADIGVGYPMTRPNAADADAVLSSPTFLPPPKSDPYMGKRVFGKNVQGMVRGVARCGENGPRMYVVGGQIVSRARVAAALRKEQRERDIAEGRMPAPAPRARPRKPAAVVMAPPPRLPELPMPSLAPPIEPSRIIDVQAEEVVRVPRAAASRAGKAQTTLALDAPLLARSAPAAGRAEPAAAAHSPSGAPMTANQLLALAKSYPSVNTAYADGQDAADDMARRILATVPQMDSSRDTLRAVKAVVDRIAEVIGGRLSRTNQAAQAVAEAKTTRARNLAMKAAEANAILLRDALEDFETILREDRPQQWINLSRETSALGHATETRRKVMRQAGF